VRKGKCFKALNEILGDGHLKFISRIIPASCVKVILFINIHKIREVYCRQIPTDFYAFTPNDLFLSERLLSRENHNSFPSEVT
jgi:hypothetical protein